MKNTLAIIFLLFTSVSLAQPVAPFPTINGKINFSEVVPVEGTKKEELYVRARIWFANTFQSANHVIQLDDEENGILIGKGSIITPDAGGDATWEFTVKIQLRDGRYKADIYDIYYQYVVVPSRLPASIRSSLGSIQYPKYNLDLLYAEKNPKSKAYKLLHDRKGNLRKGFATDQEKFISLLASIRKQLAARVTLDDF